VGCGTKPLERGWTLSYFRVAKEERHQVGVEITASPQLRALVLEFFLVSEKVNILRQQVTGGKALTTVCAYAPNSS